MKHLFDTSTIIHVLKTENSVEAVARYCQDKKEPFTITDIVLNELNKETFTTDCFEDENSIYINTKLFVSAKIIEMIDVEATVDSNVVKQNYNEIRRRYYGWMTNIGYCQKLMEKGDLDKKEFCSPHFRRKDSGECSLIAVALTCPKEHIIISEDNGTVYKHKDKNIFDFYKDKNIAVVKYNNWVHKNHINLE